MDNLVGHPRSFMFDSLEEYTKEATKPTHVHCFRLGFPAPMSPDAAECFSGSECHDYGCPEQSD